VRNILTIYSTLKVVFTNFNSVTTVIGIYINEILYHPLIFVPMIKSLIIIFISGLLFSSLSTFSEEKKIKENPDIFAWSKPDKNFWMGSDYKCYKLGSDNVLQTSDDFVNWRVAKDSVWKDRFEHKMCVSQNKLLVILNNMEWEEVPDKSWQSIDGNWYHFDKNMILWKSSANPDLVSIK
jgi:hypothetical protein